MALDSIVRPEVLRCHVAPPPPTPFWSLSIPVTQAALSHFELLRSIDSSVRRFLSSSPPPPIFKPKTKTRNAAFLCFLFVALLGTLPDVKILQFSLFLASLHFFMLKYISLNKQPSLSPKPRS